MTERRRPLDRGRAGMSEREYAAHAGLSRGAIQKARASGRLVLHADGSIDAAASDARRAPATDPSKQRGRRRRRRLRAGAGSRRRRGRRDAAGARTAGAALAGGATFLQAQTANEVLKAQERRLKLQKLKGELVDRARAEALVFRLAREKRDAWVELAGPRRGADRRRARARSRTPCRRSWKPMSAQHLDELAEVPARSRMSGSIFAFDGAEALLRAWGGGLKPDPLLTVSEWADRYRMLSSRARRRARAATAPARTPYMKEIMDALSPGHPAQRIVFMKAAQVGATEAGNNWLGFIIHHAPGPMLAVQPTVELAKRFSRQRIDPLIEESPALRDKVKPARSRDAGNTMLSKEFAGGILVMTGANRRSACARCRRATSSSTRSTPIRRRPTRKAIRSRSPRRGR